MTDNRKPVLEKIGCYFAEGTGKEGFVFFSKQKIANGDVFIYNEGILWRLKK